jgi:CTP:molybdopterin cytidylyltransferase MocA
MLRDAGASRVVVVLGASADEARALVPDDTTVVLAEDWANGMSESLRTGLASSTGDVALITLVDLPELPVAVADRLLAIAPNRETLRQAIFDGRPGHPVLIGSAHWNALAETLSGDRGARAYLVAHGVEEVECGDLDPGEDIDGPVQ